MSNPLSYTKAEPGECVVEVGHRTRADRVATWVAQGRPELTVCDRHKGQYETAFDDYSHLVWRRIVAEGDAEGDTE